MQNQKLKKRLRPLYAASFFEGFVLWYAVEKLFMRSISFSDAQIAFAGILVSVAMLIVQAPSGILADRWSRRGMLIIASCLLIASTVAGALSHAVISYYAAAALWGTYFGIYLGMYDSI